MAISQTAEDNRTSPVHVSITGIQASTSVVVEIH